MSASDRDSLRVVYVAASAGPLDPQRNSLRLSLRSLFRYAPTIKVIVQHSGERPPWLVDTDHVVGVPVTGDWTVEPFAESKVVDHFVWMHDESFFGAPRGRADWFDSGGAPLVFLSERWGNTAAGPDTAHDPPMVRAWRATNRLLDSRFGPQPRPFPLPAGGVQSRALWQECTSEPPFAGAPVTIPWALQSYWALHTGRASLGKLAVGWLTDGLETRHKQLFFLSDPAALPAPQQRREIMAFLETEFPDKAPCEK